MPPLASAQESPLPPCPNTPNCYRASLRVPLPPAETMTLAKQEVRRLSGFTFGSATEVERISDNRLRATFRVLVFTDDLELAVTPDGDGSVIHVRSASRTGRSDLGVNRRRVEALFDAIRTLVP
jgi:uncharacterized protein (DUF1499 family)